MTEIILYILIAVSLLLAVASYYFFNNYNKTNKKFDSLSKQIQNYESIIDQANDAMLVIDIVDGRIHQTNPSASQLLGYTEGELEKKSLFDLHPQEYLDKSSRIIADVWEKGGLIFKDIPFRTKGGQLLPVECSAKVAPFAGRPAIVIYARDIRERLRLEKEIHDKNQIIEQKNKDITDSINYAKRIQQAIILPSKDGLKQTITDSFIFFKAKDIISGDFYWHVKKDDENILFAAADCTGHGVPGALMSMIGNMFLNQIVRTRNITKPAEVLNQLRIGVVNALQQPGADSDSQDGMDIALCNFNPKKMKLQYAGAFNNLWLIRGGKLEEVRADKLPVGSYVGWENTSFSNHEINLQKGDTVYVFSDGYADQFGGPKGKKFKYRQLAELLLSIQDNTMDEQKSVLYYTLEQWKGNLAQVDDILVMGIRV